jgi:drug/metabolite transporter (DMT)-like permease
MSARMTAPATSPPLSASKRSAGYLLAASGAALFSTKAIFIKLAYQEQINASLMLAYRMAFALPFFVALGVWAVASKKARREALPDRNRIAAAMGTGFFGYYLASYFDFAGLQYISAQLERLVLFTYPIMIMFLSAVLLGERVTRHGLVAAAVTYTGLGIAFLTDLPAGGRDTMTGTLLVLAAGLSFAIHQIYAKTIITSLGSVLYTSISMSAASVLCIAHHAIAGRGDFSASPRFMGLAAGCAVFATVLPALLINASLARITSTSVAMISTLSPIVTIVLAVTILGEPFTWADAIGSLLVIAGVGIYAAGDSRVV